MPPRAAGKAPKVRVLILTNDSDLGKMIRLSLVHGNFVARLVTTAKQAETTAKSWPPQIAVVEADLGDGGDGIPLLAAPHAGRRPIGVIAITRRGSMQVKLKAFAAGADDIITVPFIPEEFIARILAVAKRTVGSTEFYATMRMGDLEIDLLHRKVTISGEEIQLSSLEQSLLYLLAANAGEVLTRERILDAVWGVDYIADSNVVEAQMRILRLRLQNDARKPRYIETVAGEGYRFIPHAAGETPSPARKHAARARSHGPH